MEFSRLSLVFQRYITIIFAVSIPLSSAQESCVACNINANCKPVNPVNISIQEHAMNSPFFELIRTSYPPGSKKQISVCDTFFPINNSTYYFFRSSVNEDMTTSIQLFIIADIPGCTGAFRQQGLTLGQGNSTIVSNTLVINVSCESCQPIYALYSYIILGPCSSVNSSTDSVFGLSGTPDNSDQCLSQFESFVQQSNFRFDGFARTSGGCGSRRCVVYFNNATCVNAFRVSSSDAIRYPEDTYGG